MLGTKAKCVGAYVNLLRVKAHLLETLMQLLGTLAQRLWVNAKCVRAEVKPLGGKTHLLGTQAKPLGAEVKWAWA